MIFMQPFPARKSPGIRPPTGLFPAIILILAAGNACAASLTLSPSAGTGRPGEVVALKGSGFPPNAKLAVSIDDVPV
jgi:hypothetical protein